MSTQIVRSPEFDFNKIPDPGAAELIVAGSLLGGWTINLPCGAAEFRFPAIADVYVALTEMSRGERENLDKWLAVEMAVDRSTGRDAVDLLIVEAEAVSHERADVVEAAVRYVHDGHLRRCLGELFAKATFMLTFDRRPGVIIGYVAKTLNTLRGIEHVRVLPPTEADRVARYTRRIDAARSIRADDGEVVAA